MNRIKYFAATLKTKYLLLAYSKVLFCIGYIISDQLLYK